MLKKWNFLIVSLIAVLMLAGNARADFAFGGTTTPPAGFTGGGTFFNSVLGDSNFDESIAVGMSGLLGGGQSALVISSVDDSLDANDYYTGVYDASDLVAAFGATNQLSFGGVTHDATYAYYTEVSIDGVVNATVNRVRASVSGGNVVIEVSTDSGVNWATIPVSKTYTYGELLALYATNSSVAQQSRKEKAKVSSRLTSKMVATRVMNVFSPKPNRNVKVSQNTNTNPFAAGYADNSGLSSGDDVYAGLGLWSMGAYAKTDVTKSGARSDGDVGIFMLGVDKLFLNDKLAVGIGGGYENSWSKTKLSGRSDDGEGFALSPYVAYRVTDAFVLKGVLNAAWNEYDASNGGRDYSGQRLMGDMSGEYTWLFGQWLLAAEAGYMYVDEDFNNNYNDIYLSEARLGGKVGYEFGQGFMSYLRGTYYHELASSSAPGWDDSTYEGALGLEYSKNHWIIGVEGFDNFNSDQNTLGGSVLVRYEF